MNTDTGTRCDACSRKTLDPWTCPKCGGVYGQECGDADRHVEDCVGEHE